MPISAAPISLAGRAALGAHTLLVDGGSHAATARYHGPGDESRPGPS